MKKASEGRRPWRQRVPDKASGAEETDSARRRALLSIFINLSLALFKGFFGMKAGSRALLSDAVHSASDVVASVATFVGIWAANKKHPAFPYGLYKAETLATVVSSAAILIAGYEIAKSAVTGPEIHPDLKIALPVAAVSLLVSLIFGLMQVRAGRRLGRPALVADGKDYLADSLSTLVVLAGLVGNMIGLHLDRVSAVVVSLFVFKAGGTLLWSALKELLDAAVDRETELEIIRFVESHPVIEKVKRVYSRGAGGKIIIDMDVAMKTRSHETADRVADQLEEEIVERYPKVVLARLRPHFEPSRRRVRITPLEGPDGPVSAHLSSAPWFLLETYDVREGRVMERKIVENPYATADRRKGYLVGKWLLGFGPDEVVVEQRHGGTAEALLEGAGVSLGGRREGLDPEAEA